MSSNETKKQGKTIKEQAETYGDFDRYEMINHVRYDLKPSPTVNHQKLITHLLQSLYQTCQPNGVILVAPIDVFFDEGNVFQPDIVFISNENAGIIKEARIEGAPDLVAEILSPSTGMNDKVRKKEQYERFGVKEYWIVDPVHLLIEQFVLENGKYHLQAVLGDGDMLTSEQISCISIDVKKLFDAIR